MFTFSFIVVVFFFIIGILSGSLGALLGIGGGVINVPFMLQAGLSPEVARSAGLLLSSLTGISAYFSHRKSGNIQKKEIMPYIIFAIIGVLIGISFQFIFKIVFPKSNYAKIFKSFFLIVLVVALIKMLGQYFVKIFPAQKTIMQTENNKKTNDYNNKFWLKAFVAVPGGFLAGVLGIGGGIYYGPVLKTVVHYPIKKAIPLSSGLIAVSVPTGAVIAHIIYLLSGDIQHFIQSLLAALCIGMGTLFGVYFGTMIFKRLSSKILNLTYVVLISYNIVKLALGLIS